MKKLALIAVAVPVVLLGLLSLECDNEEPAAENVVEIDVAVDSSANEAMLGSVVDVEEKLPSEPLPEADEIDEITVPEGMIRVKGRVSDEGGAPIADATLVLYHDNKQQGLDDAVVERTISDERGEYEFPTLVAFAIPSNHSYEQDRFHIIATHNDYALAWNSVRQCQHPSS